MNTESLDQENIHYDEEELVKDYWINLCLAEFWAKRVYNALYYFILFLAPN